MPKISREKFKVMHSVFDDFTNRTIFRLMGQEHFEGLESSITMGKEANIFIAIKEDKKVIVKIYRLENCDFKKMYDYIKEDTRYLSLKGKMRKIIFAWVQREFRNMLKAREAGVRVPTPITFMNNIIVMECIGDMDVAPKLKDAPPKDMKKFLDDIILNMKKLYRAGLVHADLSSFNILNNKEKPLFIDMSQTTTTKSTRADEFLDRDIKNVSTFFRKHGLDPDEFKIKKRIKG